MIQVCYIHNLLRGEREKRIEQQKIYLGGYLVESGSLKSEYLKAAIDLTQYYVCIRKQI